MFLFINKNNNLYIQSDTETIGLSFHDITLKLGFNKHQLHSIFGPPESSITVVAVKVFTKEVVFVLTEDNISHLDKDIVGEFISDNTVTPMYDSVTVQDILLEGIKDKAFTYKFISEVMGVKIDDVDGEIFIEKFDIYLFFANGILSSFKFGNELNKWSRYIKEINPAIITNYSKEASFFRGGNQTEIFAEVNRQCEDFAGTPDGFNNKYVNLHKTSFGNIDFSMLLVCHYGKIISEGEFKHFNAGRYKLLGLPGLQKAYVSGGFQYIFDEFGNLLRLNKIIK